MSNLGKLNILVCPLGWGLGHASRVIPIIRLLMESGHRVVVAADEESLALVKCSCPNVVTEIFPSFKIQFKRGNSQLLPLLWVAVRLPLINLREHRKLKKLARHNRIDLVISDNRYGLWLSGVMSVMVTHQLRVIPPRPFKFLTKASEILIRHWLKRFNHVWVPDNEGAGSIAGVLSSFNGLRNVEYLGLLSRLTGNTPASNVMMWEMVAMVSGPEPQRSIFVELVANLARSHSINCLVVEGKPQNGVEFRRLDEIWYAGHLPDEQLVSVLCSCRYLLVRGGYSTIMDLLALGISGLLIPTPGQTEQEYLAHYLSVKGLFRSVPQQSLPKLDLKEAERRSIPLHSEYSGNQKLKSCIDRVISGSKNTFAKKLTGRNNAMI